MKTYQWSFHKREDKMVVGGMELAINDDRNNPSGYIVLYLGSGKGEEYSCLQKVF